MRVITLALWLTLGLGAVAPTPAHADVASFQTVQGIFDQCNKGDAFCYGFVRGIFEVLALNGQTFDASSLKINGLPAVCYTGTVTAKAMIQAFRNWAEKHPEHWNRQLPYARSRISFAAATRA
jgi:Rap1a immunity proteins